MREIDVVLRDLTKWIQSLNSVAATNELFGKDPDAEWISRPVEEVVAVYVRIKECEHLEVPLLELWKTANDGAVEVHGIRKLNWNGLTRSTG